MPSVNKVILIGNLCADPELRYTTGGTAVAEVRLAINRRYTAANGDKHEEVTYVTCEAWSKSAETIREYVRKGDPFYVEGRLKEDRWEKEGVKHSRMKVVIETFQFLGGRRDGSGSARRGSESGPSDRERVRGDGPHTDPDDGESVPF